MLTLLGDHDLGRLDYGADPVALAQLELLGATAGDHRLDEIVADADGDMSEHIAQGDGALPAHLRA